VTIPGLTVTGIEGDVLEVKGLVPGPRNGLLIIQKYA
jgi:ribosomal protein L3